MPRTTCGKSRQDLEGQGTNLHVLSRHPVLSRHVLRACPRTAVPDRLQAGNGDSNSKERTEKRKRSSEQTREEHRLVNGTCA